MGQLFRTADWMQSARVGGQLVAQALPRLGRLLLRLTAFTRGRGAHLRPACSTG